MKKLSQEEIANMTLEKAWNIAKEFGDFHADNGAGYDYEDVLPYEKDVILLALLKILSDDNHKITAKLNNETEKEAKSLIRSVIMLLMNYIPNEKQYRSLLELIETSKKLKNN